MKKIVIIALTMLTVGCNCIAQESPANQLLSLVELGLKDEDPSVRLAAVQKISLNRSSNLNLIQIALKDEDPKVRISALKELSRQKDIKGENLLNIVSPIINTDQDPKVRIKALDVLFNRSGFAHSEFPFFGQSDVVGPEPRVSPKLIFPLIKHTLENDKDASVRKQALNIYVRIYKQKLQADSSNQQKYRLSPAK